jgi:hypothetical protein
MTFKTDFSVIKIGTSPQELGASCMVIFVAGQTFDLTVVEWKRVGFGINGSNIDRMMVFTVFMAVEALQ